MASVIGFGGIFVKSKNSEALQAWYRDMLGIELQKWGGAKLWSRDERSFVVWNSFATDTKYFEPSEREFMLNFKVDDLDEMLGKLRAAGANVLDRRDDGEFGKFGYVVDPDGTLIELWQAPAK